ncbi:MAG: AAA domain-containing protein, partial [Nakamurella sp.]
MAQPTGEHADARAQVLNVIDFLSAYDAQRNPPIRRLEDHKLYRLAGSTLPAHPAVRVRPTEDVWLSVDFLDLPTEPVVPEHVSEMLAMGMTLSPDFEPELIQPPEPPPDLEPDSEMPIAIVGPPADDEWVNRVAPARSWIDDVWRPWSAQWHAVQEVKQLHRNLFEQRERLALDRDVVELVWGFGRLRWTDQEAAGPPTVVDHPLLTIPVEIDAAHGSEQLQVRPSGALEVESRLLIGLDVHDRNGYTAIRQTIAGDPIDPWIEQDRDDVLRRLVRAVDDEGVLLESGSAKTERAVVDPGWTLFLRRRVPESEGFLQVMRELYVEDLAAIPAPLRSILTNDDATGDGLELDETASGGAQDALLLPLPANEQQQRILRLAQRHPGVAVQGPPGTGKSHTIANLISHYVAYGKRVLVVAEKEQALKVLADKVPEGIRDLTVSVLGADEEGRRRLGRSISQIQTGVGQVDRSVADARIVELTVALDALDRRYAEITAKLLRTRQAEISQLPGDWRAGAPLTPQLAASWVAEHEHILGYIPDAITDLAPPPLVAGEVAEVVDLLRTIGPERARLAGDVLPDRSRLANPAEVAEWLRQIQELSARADRARQALRDGSKVAATGIDQLQELTDLLVRERDWYVKIS